MTVEFLPKDIEEVKDTNSVMLKEALRKKKKKKKNRFHTVTFVTRTVTEITVSPSASL